MSVIRILLFLALSALPLLATTSYANPGGTGDRRSSITVTCSTSTVNGGPICNGTASLLLDGVTSQTGFFFNGVSPLTSANSLTFDFGSGNYFVIDEAKFYESSIVSQGTWQWQGSEDNSSYTSIGSSFVLGTGASPQVITALSGNTTQYRYYRLIAVSGAANNGPWIEEFEFKISLVMGPPPSSSTDGYAVVM